MNLPAVYDETYGDQTFEDLKNKTDDAITNNFLDKVEKFKNLIHTNNRRPGLGFKFHYEDTTKNRRNNLINLCYNIVKGIWNENGGKDNLFFYYKDDEKYIVNDINPFGYILENEL